MKTKRALLLLMLMIAAGCDDSTQTEQAAEIARLQEQVQNLLKITAEKAAADKAAADKAAAEKAGDEKAEEEWAVKELARREQIAAEKAKIEWVVKELARREQIAAEKDAAEKDAASTTNTIGMTFNRIPAGTFMMGSPETEKGRLDDERQHLVTISKAFYMQTTEVTQGQWIAVMGTKPWRDVDRFLFDKHVKEGPKYAAPNITYVNAVAYCKKLSEKEGKTYRLPTEAEWEYACRAGTTTTWSFGDDDAALGDYAWYEENTNSAGVPYVHEVGLKRPNAWGLYDMHGNLLEWCHDYYGKDYYKSSPETNPRGPSTPSDNRLQIQNRPKYFNDPRPTIITDTRVIRGGAVFIYSRFTRSSKRAHGTVVGQQLPVGFRLVRELD